MSDEQRRDEEPEVEAHGNKAISIESGDDVEDEVEVEAHRFRASARLD